MAVIKQSDRLPQCSRCRGDLTISAVAPKNDKDGRPIHLELCPSCDADNVDRPAASRLLQFLASGSGRAEETAHLMMEWTKEVMATHGWHWQEGPPNNQP